ncbi:MULTISPECIES: GNAT family N-acetyltransferase [Pseudidiomarina]|uniref:N-acetylglutamate synthase-like GNAT family acetyltransferase n=2 Tax=Pseudidiomarina TaxID=2800384 RepID=A0A368UN66_9GAMM|nr:MULTISPECIES: GNAT family N-acetyltransferase [Pseudidiomarina]PWW09709.1 N-acetylglutamate synthase-like GNAT family acetyltransferase [Pseudidiomarina maritima]RBP87425.1 N-acetylglutamate synthase-like GNAT family acetyltransferase [Pseudidiomarina tainanensis]RCW29480.1 N-acetylglutamate synthase-like GNAT family acetyltransferase [Pseudidiomarina tainanensis]
MVSYKQLTAADFDAVIELGNKVHGDNYLTDESLADYAERGIKDGINLNWLAFVDGQLAGIRLTFAPGNWELDDHCTPAEWPVTPEQMCYFKCVAVDPDIRGAGIGRGMLERSINEAKKLGCRAGLAHIWMQSPDNAAFEYFTRCGGELIEEHGKRWYDLSVNDGYHCPVCDGICYCSAGEMILRFK